MFFRPFRPSLQETMMTTAPRSAFLALPALLLGLALMLPATRPALANESSAESALQEGTQGHAASMKTPAGKFVQDLGDSVISVIADPNVTADKRTQKFRQILRDSFDLPTIGRFVIGRSWNVATSDQQKEYMQLFEELVVKTYGSRMSLYTGEGFSVIGTRPESEKDTIVTSNITHPDGSEPTVIDWRVRLRDGKLGVIDVVVEGVSLSVTQRQEYASVIQRNGGQIDGLLDLMRQQLKDADAPQSVVPEGQHG